MLELLSRDTRPRTATTAADPSADRASGPGGPTQVPTAPTGAPTGDGSGPAPRCPLAPREVGSFTLPAMSALPCTLPRTALAALVLLLTPAAAAAQATQPEVAPYLWLEEVEGEQALAWARARNAESKDAITATPEFDELSARLLALYDSADRIPYVSKMGDHLYNHWTDADHKRGLWRRTTLDSYRTDTPAWEVLIDLDALGEAEGESWVWHGADCLPPEYTRCIVSLSPGGSDAEAIREFDTATKAFVPDGFALPAAKQWTSWIDADTLFVGTDFGEGSLTTSGYPRVAKRWARGTPVSQAVTVFEGEVTDVWSAAEHDATPGYERDLVWRTRTFWERDAYLLTKKGLTLIELPTGAKLSLWKDRMLVELRNDWELGDTTYKAGSLLTASLTLWMKGKRKVTVLFEPSDTTSLVSISPTKNHVILNTLDTVRSAVEILTPGKKGWSRASLPGLDGLGRVTASAVDPDHSDDYFLNLTGFLTPSTLAMGTIGAGEAQTLKQLPALFDAEGLEVTQHFATSKDGTRIPYFQINRGGLALDGTHPTLLYGYGGFEVSLRPSYSATRGIAWLERGGVSVVANIRGGGEFGPAWHQAALKEKRHKAYEDFAAVARDLVRRGVTTHERLAAQGGSNGGLLVGNMYTLYPELFGAIHCAVPLLDMRRYSKLLAGASWMGEYGDPDVPEQWEYIQTFSPYHNLDPAQDHPPMLITTSTRDDRVHPGHARKMTAKLQELGEDVLYYENIEGGHGGAADNAQAAFLYALEYTFLWEVLHGRPFTLGGAATPEPAPPE